MITVIIPCWKRFRNFEKVIQSWLVQDEVSQVIIWDNSGNFRTKLPVLVISSSKNLGPVAKFSLAQFAKNDLILYADDDLIAKKGLAIDLLKYWNKGKMVGIMGRRFTGKGYYNSKAYHAGAIKEPVAVDYLCGIIMLAGKEHSLIDFGKCPGTSEDWLEDIWWQQQLKDVSLWIAPTKNYQVLPESKDKYAEHMRPSVKKKREEFYQKYLLKIFNYPYRENYQRPFDNLFVEKKDLVGAEIGVYKGFHANEMLKRLSIKKLYLVDSWQDYKDYCDRPIKQQVAKALGVAQILLRKFASKIVWMKKFSADAVKSFEDESLDFVYIDANHQHKYVYQDIKLWAPKVKIGGYIGGHDYRGIGKGLDFPGVRHAVNEYCKRNDIDLMKKKGTTSVDWWFKK